MLPLVGEIVIGGGGVLLASGRCQIPCNKNYANFSSGAVQKPYVGRFPSFTVFENIISC